MGKERADATLLKRFEDGDESDGDGDGDEE